MTHSQIASVAEPWVLLPLVYATKADGVLSCYSHMTSHIALNDFIKNLPEQEQTYHSALNHFLTELYNKQCRNNETYFLDKTPRYYLIIPEIVKIFPDAKFIFLFRNPLHIMSSMIETWGKGSLNKMYEFNADLYDGFNLLSLGYKCYSKNAFSLNYETFVQQPEASIRELCSYLDLDYEESMLSLFSSQNTNGSMGDPTGVYNYSTVSMSSLDKWKRTFSTSFRKSFVKNYIASIDAEMLGTQGYNKNELLININDMKTSFSLGVRDRLSLLYSFFVGRFNANIFFGKTIKSWLTKSHIS
jgi:hypothetical protein